MSKLNKIFQSVPVKIPDRSGFDLSHESLFTAYCGTETPAAVFEVLPGDTFSIGAMQKVTLPPFAVPFMGRVDACLEAFFVPNRILWKGWQAFITQNNGTQSVSAGGVSTGVPLTVPLVDLSAAANAPYLRNSSLAHYLGMKVRGVYPQYPVSALPFLAYHKIMDDYYRDENNMKPFFCKNPVGSLTASQIVNVAPNIINSYASVESPVLSLAPSGSTTPSTVIPLIDSSIGLGSLRQRCWAKDYFTTATTRPQAGANASVSFATNGDTGNFTIATLRAANSLQKWLERNNIAGTEYGSQILAHFGVTPPDAVLDKAVFLGQQRMPVVVGSVENNTAPAAESDANSFNPYGNTLGAAAGFGSGFDKGSLVDEFTAKEHGYIMVLFCLVPHAYYDTGIDRLFIHRAYGDFAWPEFANIGDQPIMQLELSSNETGSTAPITEQDIFGYNQRYSEYKFKLDKVAGLLEDGQNLSVYALKRTFNPANTNETPQLGKDFLTIPRDFLDQVSNVNTKVSEFGCLVDVYFDARALRVLPEYSLPSL